MSSDEDRLRITAARAEAHSLGYLLDVTEALNMPAPNTHMALAAPDITGQPTMGRFLTYGPSAADVAEAGVDILRGIVERGDPWPKVS